jgi:hypothetical protein
MSHEDGEARDGGPGAGGRLLPALPGLLLVLVAVNQLVLYQSADLSPWKGGGFGMFSSSEGGWTRHTHLFVASATGEVEVDLPADLEDSEQRLRGLPSDARLEQFARALSAALASEYPRNTGVRIELWRTHFDRVDLTPQTELMRDYRHPAPADDAG